MKIGPQQKRGELNNLIQSNSSLDLGTCYSQIVSPANMSETSFISFLNVNKSFSIKINVFIVNFAMHQ